MKRPLPRPSYARAAPILLIFALLPAFLVFAAGAAAAETLTGESTTPSFIEGSPSAEFTIVKGAASFEPVSGRAVFDITTAAPHTTSDGELLAALSTAECPPVANPETLNLLLLTSSPLLLFESSYEETTVVANTGSRSTPMEVPASKSVSGTTTTLSVTSGNLVQAGFRCAIIGAAGSEAGETSVFPIKAPPSAPAPAPTPEPAPTPAPAPAPAPAAISIAKPKPLKVKAGNWRKVHVKVTNSGATATAQGSLRVKAAKGVLVKPEVQKLPILAPGATFTLSVRVNVTGKAKKKSTLAVTGTAPGVTGTGSIVLLSVLSRRVP